VVADCIRTRGSLVVEVSADGAGVRKMPLRVQARAEIKSTGWGSKGGVEGRVGRKMPLHVQARRKEGLGWLGDECAGEHNNHGRGVRRRPLCSKASHSRGGGGGGG
jgi:hypothetical protein